MNSRTQTFVLLLFGATLLRLASGDVLLQYVRPTARPLVLAAAGTVLLLGIAQLLPAVAGRAGSRAGWLVLAPVLAIVIVAPPPLGALTATRAPHARPRPAAAYPPLPAGHPLDLRLSEVVLRAAWALPTLHGRQLRVAGFVVSSTGRGFLMARLVITCCAADAETNEIDVVSQSPAPRPGTWVSIVGGVDATTPDDRFVPVLRATEVVTIPRPGNPYG